MKRPAPPEFSPSFAQGPRLSRVNSIGITFAHQRKNFIEDRRVGVDPKIDFTFAGGNLIKYDLEL